MTKSRWILCAVLTAAILLSAFMTIGMSVVGMDEEPQKEVGEEITWVCNEYLAIPPNALAENGYTNILRTYTDAQTILRELGVAETDSTGYTEEFFRSFDLLAIAFSTNPAYSIYTPREMWLHKEQLLVTVEEKIPEIGTLVKSYKAVLITVNKGRIPEGTEVVAQRKPVLQENPKNPIWGPIGEKTPPFWFISLILIVAAAVTAAVVVIAKRRLAKRGQKS